MCNFKNNAIQNWFIDHFTSFCVKKKVIWSYGQSVSKVKQELRTHPVYHCLSQSENLAWLEGSYKTTITNSPLVVCVGLQMILSGEECPQFQISMKNSYLSWPFFNVSCHEEHILMCNGNDSDSFCFDLNGIAQS